MFTLEELQSQGIEVDVKHFRFRNEANEILPYGGRTDVQLNYPDGTVLQGRAVCSVYDNFCRRRGINIAIGRALKTGSVSNYIKERVEKLNEQNKNFDPYSFI